MVTIGVTKVVTNGDLDGDDGCETDRVTRDATATAAGGGDRM